MGVFFTDVALSVCTSFRRLRTAFGAARTVGVARIVAAAAAAVATTALDGLVGEQAAAQTPVRFSLDSKFEGPSAPFLVGIDQGFYRDEGLNVAIDTASGSRDAITRVASGHYDMGVGDINALIKFRDQNPGASVRAVFMVYNRPPFSIVTRKTRGVAAPKDLEGKKLGAPAADSVFAYWKIFVHAAGINASKVTIEDVGAPVREPMLAAGQLDAITGVSFSSYVDLKDRGVPVDDVVVMMMADYGVALYGHAVIVSPDFAAAHPEAVKAFLRAFVKALKSTARNPAAAIESVLRRNDAARKDVELERLTMALHDNILTPEARAGGLGNVDSARLDKAIDQIGLTYAYRTRPNGADIFDPSALPPAGDTAD